MNKKAPAKKITDPIAAIEQLADQFAQHGCFGLQDAHLLLIEAIRERQLDKKAFKATEGLLPGWFDLVTQFQASPKQTADELSAYLRRPEFNIPLADEEFEFLAEQIRNDAETLAGASSSPAPIEQFISDQQVLIIEQLADQAAADGLYGLQDINLVLAEALRELAANQTALDTACMDALSSWPHLIASYRSDPGNNAESLISFLRHPALNAPLGEDEFTMLQEQLASEVVPGIAQPKTDLQPEAATVASLGIEPKPQQNAAAPVSRVAQELVDLLLMESEQVRAHLQGIIIGDNESVSSCLQETEDELERLANAANTAGFECLSRVSTHVIHNIQRFLEQIDAFTSERLDLLLEWLDQTQEYLNSFEDAEAGQLIVSGLNDEQWAVPLPFEEMAAILLQIRSEGSDVGLQLEPARKEAATDDDVSLALPDDVNQELLDLLLQELPVHTQQFSESIQRLHSGGTEKDVQIAQRVAHTLKGSANTVGIKGIAVLTHQLEDILIACANEKKLPNKALSNSLITASDCLESMTEALLGTGASPNDAKAVLQEILDWANRIDKNGLPDADSDEFVPEVKAAAPSETPEEAAQEQSQATMIRVSSDQIETLFRVSGESIILNSQAQETSRRIKNQLKTMQAQFDLLQQLGIELEQLIDIRDLTGRSFGIGGTGFDAMEMDQYNELHTVSRRMAEAAIDAREISVDINKELDQMDLILDDQQQHVIDAQEVVMETRLVAISTITPRLQRSIRQTCRMTGKQSDLVVIGDKLLIDGDTLNAMVDPLMHILRNAVDHGIEKPEDRQAAGKLTSGRITFEFDREANNILVRCRDDGKGLDYAAIRAAAEKRGLLNPGEDVSEEDLKRFILRPNFSSRTVSTQTSGRGVGMDVVRSQILNMGGALTLNSEPGKGMTIEIRVPLPLSLTYALLTYVGRFRVAVANKGISQIIYSAAGEVTIDEAGKEMLSLDGESYPVARLIDLLHVPDSRKIPRPFTAILLVEQEDKTTAVLLDAITDTLDVVIKSMGHYVGKIPGYIGVTILGDGAITPVLDMAELLRAPAYASTTFTAELLESAEQISTLPTVLVVDDSLSQRRALEQLLNDAGFRVRTSRDGIEAAEALVHFKPDVILTDLEMPRMNGIELTAHIRNQEKIKHLPVIMITSRTTQKHRQLAEEAGVNGYFTKPVRDEELLLTMQSLMDLAGEKTKQSA
jgi:chemotaxis protein histidine kinase CheA/ActR/RegA family two-component response regulator